MRDDVVTQIAGGLAGRLRSLVMVIDRLDRLESGSGKWMSRFATAELESAASEMTLRAFRTSADATNFAILHTLAAQESWAMRHLIEVVGNGRLTLSERLNDLVQVGLVARMIDTDHVQITAAGANIVQLLNEVTAEVTAQYQAQQSTSKSSRRPTNY